MTKRKSSEERRAQILAAARASFIRKGFVHTRMDDIAKEAGLSKGGIYFHFKSKRELFDALHQDEYEQTLALLSTVKKSDQLELEKLAHFGALMLERFSDNETHQKFLIVLAEMGIRDHKVREKVRELHMLYVQMIADQLRKGISSGEFRNIDPEMAALILKLLVDGVEQGFAVGYDLDVTRLMTAGLDILLHGLTPIKSAHQ